MTIAVDLTLFLNVEPDEYFEDAERRLLNNLDIGGFDYLYRRTYVMDDSGETIDEWGDN